MKNDLSKRMSPKMDESKKKDLAKRLNKNATVKIKGKSKKDFQDYKKVQRITIKITKVESRRNYSRRFQGPKSDTV